MFAKSALSITVIASVALGQLLSIELDGRELEQTSHSLPNAHAHNDYHHERPLLDALEHAFCSVEADIFLVDGQLLIGHDRSELRPERTLEALYLEPLKQRVQEQRGSVYGDGRRLTLLVDIKSDGEETYRQLSRVLARYADMLSSVEKGKFVPRAVDVIISGNRPIELVAANPVRYAAVDGRLPDLDGDSPQHLIPLVSENWNSHFSWNGQGEFPSEEQSQLRAIVAKAHAQNRRLRFWATPETTECWRELLAAGVDFINTDDLAGLQLFLSDPRDH